MEPKAKRSKPDVGVLVLDKLNGRIVLCIEEISEFLNDKQDWYSDTVHIRGFDWTLFAIPFSGPNKGLKFQIDCHSDSRASPDWNCMVSVILRCTSGSKEAEICRENDIKFDATSIETECVWLQRVSI